MPYKRLTSPLGDTWRAATSQETNISLQNLVHTQMERHFKIPELFAITIFDCHIYIFLEPFLPACKLLPQCACDWRETRDYRALHGECHKGIDGRQITTSEESVTQIPSLTKKSPCLWSENAKFHLVLYEVIWGHVMCDIAVNTLDM